MKLEPQSSGLQSCLSQKSRNVFNRWTWGYRCLDKTIQQSTWKRTMSKALFRVVVIALYIQLETVERPLCNRATHCINLRKVEDSLRIYKLHGRLGINSIGPSTMWDMGYSLRQLYVGLGFLHDRRTTVPFLQPTRLHVRNRIAPPRDVE